MEVADQVAIINEGHLEQVGSPTECYDHPASEFVLTFLGPATRHHGAWVRPHDLVLSPDIAVRRPDGRLGRLERITRLGFEVRVDVALDDESSTVVQLARRDFDALDLVEGDRVVVALAAPLHEAEVARLG